MKAGVVTTLRINPRDAQSVLDVLDAVGLPRHTLSFAQCTSLALGALLETARQNKLIPEPDEFEYLNRLGPYIGPAKKSKRTKIASQLHDMGGGLRAPALVGKPVQARTSRFASPETAATQEQVAEVVQEAADSPEVDAAKKSLTRLLMEKEMKEDEGTWTAEDEEAFQRVYRVVYPNG